MKDLNGIAQLSSFLLRTSAGFAACTLTCRLLRDPRTRFLIQGAFTACTLIYWIFLLLPFQLLHSQVLHLDAPQSHLGIPADSASRAGLSIVVQPPAVTEALVSWGAAAYPLFVLLFFGFDLRRQLRLLRLRRRGIEPSTSMMAAFERIKAELGLRRARVRLLRGLSSPAVAGTLVPVVMLPACCAGWDAASLEDVLRHELAHIGQHDYLWSRFADWSVCLLFFHPGVWYARRRIRIEREFACDQAVVRGNPSRRAEYAMLLTRFARAQLLKDKGELAAPLTGAPKSVLSQRVHALLYPRNERGLVGRVASTVMALTFLVAAGLMLPELSVVLRFAPAIAVSGGLAGRPARETMAKPAQHFRRERVKANLVARAPAAPEVTDSQPITELTPPPPPVFDRSQANPAADEDRREDYGASEAPWTDNLPAAKSPTGFSIGRLVRSAVSGTAAVIRPPDNDADDRVRHTRR